MIAIKDLQPGMIVSYRIDGCEFKNLCSLCGPVEVIKLLQDSTFIHVQILNPGRHHSSVLLVSHSELFII